jgi:hypothetical protein
LITLLSLVVVEEDGAAVEQAGLERELPQL